MNKESLGKVISGNVRKFMNIVNTHPVSTVESKRGFSKMNWTCSDVRSTLTVSHMSAISFVSIHRPPVSQWQPMPYEETWLASNRHAATCTSCQTKMITS